MKTETRPYRTGFCNPSNDAASHGRCTGQCAGVTCTCECHRYALASPAVNTAVCRIAAKELRDICTLIYNGAQDPWQAIYDEGWHPKLAELAAYLEGDQRGTNCPHANRMTPKPDTRQPEDSRATCTGTSQPKENQ